MDESPEPSSGQFVVIEEPNIPKDYEFDGQMRKFLENQCRLKVDQVDALRLDWRQLYTCYRSYYSHIQIVGTLEAMKTMPVEMNPRLQSRTLSEKIAVEMMANEVKSHSFLQVLLDSCCRAVRGSRLEYRTAEIQDKLDGDKGPLAMFNTECIVRQKKFLRKNRSGIALITKSETGLCGAPVVHLTEFQ